jgi:hypothetical protein
MVLIQEIESLVGHLGLFFVIDFGVFRQKIVNQNRNIALSVP